MSNHIRMRIKYMNRSSAPVLLVCSFAVVELAGCATTAPDLDERMPRGYVYYLDGAGGGRPLIVSPLRGASG